MTGAKVFPAVEPLTETEFQLLLAIGAQRARIGFGLERLARWIGSCPKTLANAIRPKGTIRADLAFNAVTADPAAFSELFARMGWEAVPVVAQTMPDAETLAQLAELIAEYAAAMRDGTKTHPELLRIVARVRPLLPALSALVHQADRLTAPTGAR